MVTKSGFVFILFSVFLAEFPLSFCEYVDFNRAFVKNVADQRSEKGPRNIFAVFDEIINNKLEDPLNSPKYKDILDRADGIPHIKNPKRLESLQVFSKNEEPFYKTNNAFSFPRDDSSSTSSSDTDNSDESFERGAFTQKTDQQAKVIANVIGGMLRGDKENGAMRPNDDMTPIDNMGSNDIKVVDDLLLTARSTCSKAASKACKKACKKALKGVCEEYRCQSDLKKRFKSECNQNCNNRFSVKG